MWLLLILQAVGFMLVLVLGRPVLGLPLLLVLVLVLMTWALHGVTWLSRCIPVAVLTKPAQHHHHARHTVSLSAFAVLTHVFSVLATVIHHQSTEYMLDWGLIITATVNTMVLIQLCKSPLPP